MEMILENLPSDFYQNYIKHITAISSGDIMEIANKYFNTEELCEVVVGGK
jgi:predicted Zn-dependent peptidase